MSRKHLNDCDGELITSKAKAKANASKKLKLNAPRKTPPLILTPTSLTHSERKYPATET